MEGHRGLAGLRSALPLVLCVCGSMCVCDTALILGRKVLTSHTGRTMHSTHPLSSSGSPSLECHAQETYPPHTHTNMAVWTKSAINHKPAPVNSMAPTSQKLWLRSKHAYTSTFADTHTLGQTLGGENIFHSSKKKRGGGGRIPPRTNIAELDVGILSLGWKESLHSHP